MFKRMWIVIKCMMVMTKKCTMGDITPSISITGINPRGDGEYTLLFDLGWGGP